jgi:hypothetical protein
MIWYDHLAVAALTQYAGFLLDQIFRFDGSDPAKTKRFFAFAQTSAREEKQANQVELPEARRGSGAVVEAVASPDRLQYNNNRPTWIPFYCPNNKGYALLALLC